MPHRSTPGREVCVDRPCHRQSACWVTLHGSHLGNENEPRRLLPIPVGPTGNEPRRGKQIALVAVAAPISQDEILHRVV